MDSSPRQQNSKQEDERPVAGGVGSDAISGLSNNGRKITRHDVKMVQNLIERCLQLYMNKNDVVNTLLEQARIEPGFTSLVWQKLEKENVEFFKAYNLRLTLKEQIDRFNQLLVHQCQLMHYPASQDFPSHQNGDAQVPVTGLPAEPSFLQQQSGVPSTCHSQMRQVSSVSDCQVVNGFPASGSFHQLHLNADREAIVDGHSTVTTLPINRSFESEVGGGPASNGRFSLGAVEMAGFSNLDYLPPNSSYAAHMDMMPPHLQDGADGGCDYRGMPVHSFPHIPWNLSFPDLGADLASIGDHGQMENYSGSDILLDSAEEENDMVKEFFVDSVPPSSPQVEEKPDVGEL
ncbi:unnamed protein product [Linum trigynum]|uniref:Angiotensin-converting enzyme 2 n=1 Tax=Linum trigynum TaxID=586398 RepID=A0AAV2GGA9_9ROSI